MSTITMSREVGGGCILHLDCGSRDRAVGTDFTIAKSAECLSTGLDVHHAQGKRKEKQAKNFFSVSHQEVILFTLH